MTGLATSMSVTLARNLAVEDGENRRSNFVQVLCIRYPINLRKKFVVALFDLGSKVNAMHPIFAKELGLFIRLTDC